MPNGTSWRALRRRAERPRRREPARPGLPPLLRPPRPRGEAAERSLRPRRRSPGAVGHAEAAGAVLEVAGGAVGQQHAALLGAGIPCAGHTPFRRDSEGCPRPPACPPRVVPYLRLPAAPAPGSRARRPGRTARGGTPRCRPGAAHRGTRPSRRRRRAREAAPRPPQPGRALPAGIRRRAEAAERCHGAVRGRPGSPTHRHGDGAAAEPAPVSAGCVPAGTGDAPARVTPAGAGSGAAGAPSSGPLGSLGRCPEPRGRGQQPEAPGSAGRSALGSTALGAGKRLRREPWGGGAARAAAGAPAGCTRCAGPCQRADKAPVTSPLASLLG